jgi:cbb3-type cytochrome oxidase subunit 3
LLDNLSPTFIDIKLGNANDDCYPQEKRQVTQMGSAAITFACFIAFYCIVFLSLYKRNRRKNRGISLTESMETMLEEDDKYALSKIGKDSVYSYFVTGQVWVRVQVRARTLTLTGWWWAAFVTFCTQIGILVVFVMASEAKLQKETIDIIHLEMSSRQGCV